MGLVEVGQAGVGVPGGLGRLGPLKVDAEIEGLARGAGEAGLPLGELGVGTFLVGLFFFLAPLAVQLARELCLDLLLEAQLLLLTA